MKPQPRMYEKWQDWGEQLVLDLEHTDASSLVDGGGGSSIYPTIAAATAEAAGDLIFVAHEEGIVQYELFTGIADVNNKAKFTTTAGRQYRRRGHVVTLKDVGGFDPAATSHTQLLLDLGNELRWRGDNTRFEAPFEQNIKVATTAEMATIDPVTVLTLMGNITGVRNLVLNWNGCEIQGIATSYGEQAHPLDGSIPAVPVATNKWATLLQLTDYRHVEVRDLKMRQTVDVGIRTNPHRHSGLRAIQLIGDGRDFIGSNIEFNDIYEGLSGNRGGSFSAANRGRGFFVDGLTGMDCYYPLNFQKNIDHVRVNGFRSRSRRGYHFYGVHDHEVHINSSQRSTYPDDVLIQNYSDAADSYFLNQTGGVKVFYTLDGSQDLGSRSTLAHISLSSQGGAQGLVQGVEIHWDVSLGLSFQPGSIFQVSKDGTGAMTLDGLLMTGKIHMDTAAAGDSGINIGTSTDMSSDFLRNIAFKNLHIESIAGHNSLSIDGRGLVSAIDLENVTGTGALALTNFAGERLNARGVKFSNYQSEGGADAANSYAALPGGRMIQSGKVDPATSGGTVTFAHPFATGVKPRLSLETSDWVSGSETILTTIPKITALSNTAFSWTRPSAIGNAVLHWTAIGEVF